ncbi:hypothetical protein O9993_11980 [Vibrio lentus]|nr:hypothetical protein [Vibrio lentus]
MVAHAHAWEQTCQKFGIPTTKIIDQLGGMPSLEVPRDPAATGSNLDAQQITSDKNR